MKSHKQEEEKRLYLIGKAKEKYSQSVAKKKMLEKDREHRMRELYEGLMMSPEEKAAMLAEEQAKAAARKKKDPDQAAGDGAGFGNLRNGSYSPLR